MSGTQILTHLLTSFVSSCLSLIVGFLLLKNSEAFKKLAGWQTYHQHLWKAKSDAMAELLERAGRLTHLRTGRKPDPAEELRLMDDCFAAATKCQAYLPSQAFITACTQVIAVTGGRPRGEPTHSGNQIPDDDPAGWSRLNDLILHIRDELSVPQLHETAAREFAQFRPVMLNQLAAKNSAASSADGADADKSTAPPSTATV